LSEEELDLLRRFIDRSATLASPRRDALAEQLATKFGAHLPDAITPTAALAQLLRGETAARESGVAARGETGAARERYAMVAEGTPRWTRFTQRLAHAQRTGLARMSPDEVAGFVADYREIATDLARLSTASRGRGMDEVFRLSRLVAGGHNLLYRQERLAMRGIARFLFVTVPAELRRSLAPIAAAAVLFFGSGIASYLAVVRNPALAEELVAPGMIDRAEIDAARARTGQATYIDVEDYARPIVASAVFRNNVQVTFMAFASGLTAGVITVLLLLMNGMSIGSAIGLFQTKGVAALILDFVVAHSVFELSAICIAAGGGFLIAGAILLPGARTRREALVIDGRRALRLLAAASFLLFFAGAIEGLISPRADLGFAFKGAVAIASGLLIAAYASLGRGASADESREVTAYSAARALTAR
jgi:uncharacterized membrane protein SpoIIM required for sporulation